MTDRILAVKDLRDAIPTLGRTGAYALMNRKDFPSFRIGKKLFVSETALREWIAAGGTAQDERTV